LLENVRNFVSHNKSFTFRLTLRSLLDMGYQVRFGVLNAGNFGVAPIPEEDLHLGGGPERGTPLLAEAPSPLQDPAV
jgi:DNA (cytosine-5)-methyltransferase 1